MTPSLLYSLCRGKAATDETDSRKGEARIRSQEYKPAKLTCDHGLMKLFKCEGAELPHGVHCFANCGLRDAEMRINLKQTSEVNNEFKDVHLLCWASP